MADKSLKLLLLVLGLGLIAALIFHGLSQRYEVVIGSGASAFRIDRLTGELYYCYARKCTPTKKRQPHKR